MKEGGQAKFLNLRKIELLERHAATWRQNGYGNLDFEPVNTTPRGDECEIVEVDLCSADDPDAARLSG
jgi:hypothetical protein